MMQKSVAYICSLCNGLNCLYVLQNIHVINTVAISNYILLYRPKGYPSDCIN
jgi:hypothetical protein